MLLSRLILFVITLIISVIGDEDIVTNYVRCTTTKGPIVLEIYRDWSPRGADRFIDLVNDGFFTDIALYRCVDRFLTQFGISDNPAMKHWHNDEILDDKNLHKGIKRGYLSFAGGGKNTRSSQLFIAFEDLDFLGKEPWETPFGKGIT
jgi:cyclophilin family peptidyl-prolyl cis-trans isomerase